MEVIIIQDIGKMIGQGNTSEIYEAGDNYILKLYRDGMSEILCRREFSQTKIAYELIDNVPEPVEIRYVEGRIGAIYKKLTGETMLKKMFSKPWHSGHYAKNLAKYHVSIQKPVSDNILTVKEKLHGDISSVKVLTESEKQCLFDYLDSLPDGDTLCHFDFHPDNIMLNDNHYSIIDWMTACKGDKLSDVARTIILLQFSQIPRVPAIINYLAKIFQKRILREYIKQYLKITKEDIEQIREWELVIAAAKLSEWVSEKEQKELLFFIRQRIDALQD